MSIRIADQREDYWKNRVQPFWQHIWPRNREFATSGITESLVRLSIAAGPEFSSAFLAVQDWLLPIEHPHYVVHQLHESGLCNSFPMDALRLLNAIIDDQPWAPRELQQCLNAIAQTSPLLTHETQYQRLTEYSRRRGRSFSKGG